MTKMFISFLFAHTLNLHFQTFPYVSWSPKLLSHSLSITRVSSFHYSTLLFTFIHFYTQWINKQKIHIHEEQSFCLSTRSSLGQEYMDTIPACSLHQQLTSDSTMVHKCLCCASPLQWVSQLSSSRNHQLKALKKWFCHNVPNRPFSNLYNNAAFLD